MVPVCYNTNVKLYNTLSRTIELFEPRSPGEVGLYACGLTVYDFTHLGHLRKYTLDDVLVRVLRQQNFQVKHVQNVTDVGHLTSDEDTGEDKLEKGAKKYGKTVWEVAREFEDYFWKSMDLMGNARPDVSCRATEHIEQQLAMVVKLEEKGFAYVIAGDGVYFDTSKFASYGALARLNLKDQKAGSRVEQVAGKRNPTDFALWKFERPGENRAMVWSSPWHERSFPGWHIECSAMAVAYLGEQFDIHTGGIDHIPVHHTNEIAQAEAASGKHPFVNYWVHHNFLRIEGQKMSKSLENYFTIDDIVARGFHPRALRLLFLTSHYRSEMNFTWESLEGMQKAYRRLLEATLQLKSEQERTVLSPEKLEKVDAYREAFFAALTNDLATAEAVTILWDVIKSNIPGPDKYDLLISFDEVLQLGLKTAEKELAQIKMHQDQPWLTASDKQLPAQIRQLLKQRQQARDTKAWVSADAIRDKVLALGYELQDSPEGTQQVKKIQ